MEPPQEEQKGGLLCVKENKVSSAWSTTGATVCPGSLPKREMSWTLWKNIPGSLKTLLYRHTAHTFRASYSQSINSFNWWFVPFLNVDRWSYSKPEGLFWQFLGMYIFSNIVYCKMCWWHSNHKYSKIIPQTEGLNERRGEDYMANIPAFLSGDKEAYNTAKQDWAWH